MERLAKIGDIKFGKLDAYSEYMEYGADVYKTLFLASPSFHVDNFLSGKSYYIHGEKGTGKTALLKYVEIIAQEKEAFIEYIRFKKDIDEDDRNQIKRAGLSTNPFEEVIESDIPMDNSIDCILAWQVYIIKSIILRIQNEEGGVFKRNTRSWEKLVALIRAAFPNELIKIKKILPIIKRGNIKVNILDKAELDLDLMWNDEKTGLVNFNTFAKKVISLYEELEPDDSIDCYVLFDELELINMNPKKYNRDISLIRDLIVAIYYINEIAKKNNYKVFTIACIRNEVYRNAAAIGMELNKYIQDYGVEVSWNQSGGDISQHPLIQMIENRLLQSQSEEVKKAISNIWDEYFVDKIGEKATRNYIIDQTWNKPRDITRLFMLIQKQAEEKNRFDIPLFEAVRGKYSAESWEEFSNELSAKYAKEEIQAIKRLLTGITIPFSLQGFNKRIDEYKDYTEDILILSQKRKAADILCDLYRIGIIGTISNDGKWSRFSFKGNEDLDLLSLFIVHYPLRKFFSVSVDHSNNPT